MSDNQNAAAAPQNLEVGPENHSTEAGPAPNKFTRSVRWTTDGLNDWINLLGKPEAGGIFRYPPEFNWACLLRLIFVVLSFYGAILGITLITLKKNLAELPFQKWAAVVLVFGAFLSVVYYFIAWIFRVTISIRNALFAILLLTLPWLPFVALMYFLVRTVPRWLLPVVGFMLLGTIWLIPFLLTRNLCNGVRILVPEAKRWRVYSSVIVWVVVLTGGFVLITVFVSLPDT